MSRPPYPTYPRHHPHHGRSFIVVHDHDVLSGRGVNIAQHPGNERFRALVTTRKDESYCTNFTTSEKRALAEEIINHIRSLDPPGRFLKRAGRSQNSRGLNGPWEELGHRDCIKKTCQALRDCNRKDRQGYAAQVAVPHDVEWNANERIRTGLSLKEQAAAAVAKASPATLHSHHINMNPPPLDRKYPFHQAAPIYSRKDSADDLSRQGVADRLSPSVEHAAEWLQKQRNDRAGLVTATEPRTNQIPRGPTPSIHSTPAPYVAPVPVTNTPASSHLSHLHPIHSEPIPISASPTSPHLSLSMTASPQLSMPMMSYHHATPTVPVTRTAPAYSPVALLTSHVAEPPSTEESHVHGNLAEAHFGDQAFPDQPPSQTLQHFSHQTTSTDVLQSAADAAAALISHPDHSNGLSLLSGDDVNESLGISDL